MYDRPSVPSILQVFPSWSGPPLANRADVVQATYASKMDAVTREYTHLLTSQLESQRQYYEEKHAQEAEVCRREYADLSKRCVLLKAWCDFMFSCSSGQERGTVAAADFGH
jgi:hypothetical protein